MIVLNLMDCLLGDIVVFEVDYWEVRQRFRHLIFFGIGYWFGFNCVLFGCTWLFFTRTGFRFIELKLTSTPKVLFIVPEKKFEINFSHLIPPRLSSRRGTHTSLLKLLSNLNRSFPGLVLSLHLSYIRRVSWLFSRFFIISITLLFALQ